MARKIYLSKPAERLLMAACIFVYCGILVAGLWPLTPYPRNEVNWAADGKGLWFGKYGTVLSSSTFELRGSTDGSCSLALWLEPGVTIASSVILDFYAPENPLRFRIRQDLDDLVLARDEPGEQNEYGSARIDIPRTFRKGAPLLVGITASAGVTSVYLNGKLSRSTARFGLSSRHLRGRIILGNSPLDQESWSGLLSGLAIYNRTLTAAEMQQIYQAWKPGETDDSVKESKPFALFAFNERAGTVVHDQMASATDLAIPPNFQTVDHRLLKPFWAEYYPHWGYWKDLGINIGGFVPLGLCFYAYFGFVCRVNRPLMTTIVLGGATSLIIEFLQGFIPMRNSGTTDILTNTLGTAIGAFICNSGAIRGLVRRIGPEIQ